MRQADIIGHRFGRLVVTGLSHSDNGRIWLCSCDCGAVHTARTGHLRAGAVQSCGCLVVETAAATGRASGHLRRTHGMSRSRLDTTFDNMIKRCYRPNASRFERYGGRGIQICDAWLKDRSEFFRWALANGYAENLSIERIDANGHYSPSNCRWATGKEQANNTSRSRLLSWAGETLTVAQWAERLGVPGKAMQHRVNRGWAAERIFMQPYREARA